MPFASVGLAGRVGLWIRLKLAETPEFAASLKERRRPPCRSATCCSRHCGALWSAHFGAIACFALYYIATAFALGYGTKTLGITACSSFPRRPARRDPVHGRRHLASRLAGRSALGRAARADGRLRRARSAGGLLMAPLMGSGSLLEVFLFLALSLFVMGFVYGPLGGWLPSLFPARCAIPACRWPSTSRACSAAG
jgi:hypothetical protein